MGWLTFILLRSTHLDEIKSHLSKGYPVVLLVDMRYLSCINCEKKGLLLSLCSVTSCLPSDESGYLGMPYDSYRDVNNIYRTFYNFM